MELTNTRTGLVNNGTGFPAVRMRRLRANGQLREMLRETDLEAKDFIYPLFVTETSDSPQPVSSMPGVYQHPLDSLLREVDRARRLGVNAMLLFGIPSHKDAEGTQAYAREGVVQRAVSEIKDRYPDALVITDVCLCEYTDHGHCGVLRGEDVDNDSSLELLSRTALSHVLAGADIVAPSNMMDGTVGAIRGLLDSEGYTQVPVMAYAAKYASSFYGPFREAAESAPSFGDRRSYQMYPGNAREALREVALDVQEGADVVMVKPALPYLDIIRQVKDAFTLPVAAYNVSGEYAMLKAAAQNGWLDERQAVTEVLTSIKRAGADLILTYHALDMARWLSE